jgi:alpha-glucosidase
MLGLRGTIFLYQGEELGLPDSKLATEAEVDVDGRDRARTPIPWAAPTSAGPGAGFTSGRPWLPIGDTAERLNVESQAGDEGSMLELYRRLIRIRAASPALRSGTYHELFADERLLVFERQASEDAVVVAVNFSTERVPLPSLGALAGSQTLISTNRGGIPDPGDLLEPLESRWLQVIPQKTT